MRRKLCTDVLVMVTSERKLTLYDPYFDGLTLTNSARGTYFTRV